jgi:hypothetical protein
MYNKVMEDLASIAKELDGKQYPLTIEKDDPINQLAASKGICILFGQNGEASIRGAVFDKAGIVFDDGFLWMDEEGALPLDGNSENKVLTADELSRIMERASRSILVQVFGYLSGDPSSKVWHCVLPSNIIHSQFLLTDAENNASCVGEVFYLPSYLLNLVERNVQDECYQGNPAYPTKEPADR